MQCRGRVRATVLCGLHARHRLDLLGNRPSGEMGTPVPRRWRTCPHGAVVRIPSALQGIAARVTKAAQSNTVEQLGMLAKVNEAGMM